MRIGLLTKEGACFGIHQWMFHGAVAYTQLRFRNRVSVEVMRWFYFRHVAFLSSAKQTHHLGDHTDSRLRFLGHRLYYNAARQIGR